MNAKEISEKIFYSPATNGKAEKSIADGVELIEAYAKEKAWDVWKYVADQYEVHSLHLDIERIEFEKWWEGRVDLWNEKLKTPIPPSPQVTRDELIEKAKQSLFEFNYDCDNDRAIDIAVYMADFALSLNLPSREVTDEEIEMMIAVQSCSPLEKEKYKRGLLEMRDLLTNKEEQK